MLGKGILNQVTLLKIKSEINQNVLTNPITLTYVQKNVYASYGIMTDFFYHGTDRRALYIEGPPARRYISLRWRHNWRDGVSNHQPPDCVLNRLFRRRSKKTSKLRVIGVCAGKSPGPVNSPHKWPVTRKMFPFDDVIMYTCINLLLFLTGTCNKHIVKSKHS